MFVCQFLVSSFDLYMHCHLSLVDCEIVMLKLLDCIMWSLLVELAGIVLSVAVGVSSQRTEILC